MSKEVLRERRDKVLKLRDQGKSPAQISEETGMSLRAVQRTLSAAGLSNPNGRPIKLLDKDVPQLYKLIKTRAMSIDMAVSTYNISVSTIRRRLNDYERTLTAEERLAVLRSASGADSRAE